jgi:hypothetical protein
VNDPISEPLLPLLEGISSSRGTGREWRELESCMQYGMLLACVRCLGGGLYSFIIVVGQWMVLGVSLMVRRCSACAYDLSADITDIRCRWWAVRSGRVLSLCAFYCDSLVVL